MSIARDARKLYRSLSKAGKKRFKREIRSVMKKFQKKKPRVRVTAEQKYKNVKESYNKYVTEMVNKKGDLYDIEGGTEQRYELLHRRGAVPRLENRDIEDFEGTEHMKEVTKHMQHMMTQSYQKAHFTQSKENLVRAMGMDTSEGVGEFIAEEIRNMSQDEWEELNINEPELVNNAWEVYGLSTSADKNALQQWAEMQDDLLDLWKKKLRKRRSDKYKQGVDEYNRNKEKESKKLKEEKYRKERIKSFKRKMRHTAERTIEFGKKAGETIRHPIKTTTNVIRNVLRETLEKWRAGGKGQKVEGLKDVTGYTNLRVRKMLNKGVYSSRGNWREDLTAIIAMKRGGNYTVNRYTMEKLKYLDPSITNYIKLNKFDAALVKTKKVTTKVGKFGKAGLGLIDMSSDIVSLNMYSFKTGKFSLSNTALGIMMAYSDYSENKEDSVIYPALQGLGEHEDQEKKLQYFEEFGRRAVEAGYEAGAGLVKQVKDIYNTEDIKEKAEATFNLAKDMVVFPVKETFRAVENIFKNIQLGDQYQRFVDKLNKVDVKQFQTDIYNMIYGASEDVAGAEKYGYNYVKNLSTEFNALRKATTENLATSIKGIVDNMIKSDFAQQFQRVFSHSPVGAIAGVGYELLEDFAGVSVGVGKAIKNKYVEKLGTPVTDYVQGKIDKRNALIEKKKKQRAKTPFMRWLNKWREVD